MDLIGDEPTKKSKSIVVKSKGKFFKSLQVVEFKEEALEGDSVDGSEDEEMTFLTKRLQYQTRIRKGFLREDVDLEDQATKKRKMNQMFASTARN